MVSLSDTSRHSGGYFFNDEQNSINTSDTEELLRDHVALTGDGDLVFRRINTAWAIVCQILLSIALLTGSFIIPVFCLQSACGADDIALVIYIHGCFWFIFLAFDRYYRQQHYVNRLNGYLEFYRRTKNIRRMPFLITSGGNALLLIVTRILDEYCHKPDKCSFLKKENYIQIVIAMETAVMLLFLVMYLARTFQFNRRQAHPDVNQDEMLSSFIQSQSQSSDIGFRDENYVDQVLEKQADMIRYLKQHNSQLGKRILALTAQNNSLSVSRS
ncbi:transmembrane protein 192-like [Haliotis rufescens]|uniref:transmembrane protein 192-like n=1 Tax=Haliotis rufescens TaxID=6454 RepID=UPI001EB01EB4|nr:transmembrane protein 192-like [Haliotis rufescens]